MNFLSSRREFSSILLIELTEFLKSHLEGIVIFGSNANFFEQEINISKDFDILVVISKELNISSERILKFTTTFLIKYGIRLDLHVYTLPEFSVGLRKPDLVLVGLSRNFQILHGTTRFNTIFQLIRTIEQRNEFKIVI